MKKRKKLTPKLLRNIQLSPLHVEAFQIPTYFELILSQFPCSILNVLHMKGFQVYKESAINGLENEHFLSYTQRTN